MTFLEALRLVAGAGLTVAVGVIGYTTWGHLVRDRRYRGVHRG